VAERILQQAGGWRGVWTTSWKGAVNSQLGGPLMALVLAVIIFAASTSTFWNAGNISLILSQSVVIGMLALGQTLIILTAGIDLANAAIMVLGTVVIGKYAAHGNVGVALLLGLVVCLIGGGISGAIVSRLKLPPFIVTLGMLTVVTAATRLYASNSSFPITSPVITWLNTGFSIGSLMITWGVVLWLVATLLFGYALVQTAWGRHVYTVGNNPEAARLAGIKVPRVLLGVYVLAGFVYALAAWEALGRVPDADPAAYTTSNLDSITAVVIGGTSLFGGRGGVAGTLVGTLIVTVLRNGLTQAGIDSDYQNLATGILVIVAVAVDQLLRRRRRA
jgi:fructose transport system permease protein